MQRQALALFVVVALALTGGCLGLVLGDGAEFEADPAAVSDETLADSDYERGDLEPVVIEETIEPFGQERTIRVTNWQATYENALEVQNRPQESGALVVVTTPEVTVAGQTLNPVADLSNEELLEEFGDELEGELGELRDLRRVDERVEPVVGHEATVTTFAAETDIDGEEVTVDIHVTKTVHEGDVIVAIGVHPEAFQQEAPAIHELLRGIEHPAET